MDSSFLPPNSLGMTVTDSSSDKKVGDFFSDALGNAFLWNQLGHLSNFLPNLQNWHNNILATNQFLSRLVDIESPLTHSNNSRSGITSRNVKIIIADVDSTLNIGTLLVDGQHFTNYFSALFVLVAFVHTYSRRRSRRLPPSPSWHLTLSGLVLNVQFLGALQALFLIDLSSIISFF